MTDKLFKGVIKLDIRGAVWLICLLLGIQLICVGAAMAYLAWNVRHT
jgi:hypothetical protein